MPRGNVNKEIGAELEALSELREKPAGTIRITTGEHAAKAILLPALMKFVPNYPDIHEWRRAVRSDAPSHSRTVGASNTSDDYPFGAVGVTLRPVCRSGFPRRSVEGKGFLRYKARRPRQRKAFP